MNQAGLPYITMQPHEKYLFDLQGFIVVRNALTPLQVRDLNRALEANADKREQDTASATSTAAFMKECFLGKSLGVYPFVKC